ncbi:transcription termination/antitermination protein NusG [Pontibacter sp. HSC-36F09]|uniref:transcription termination/antitermination protein NusG n=1 Tax=Pontibacter sp. HSC-36F09 TaxID=2910966 RepID=UPI00211293A0|nr:UpxY family transcription antiterminator [Pontibacter sp. HSC-36F09]MCP2043997.1 transcription antitermination factor NusG [Pontibacter sp. HSC-36F09]
MEERWYAVYTKPRWEKKVSESLNLKKIQSYCPLKKVIRQWSDRKKLLYEPLFTSYVFVHVSDKNIREVKEVDGVINLVHWLGKPAVIKDEEIEAIRTFLNEHSNVQLEKVEVAINDAVKVARGFLQDREGTVVAIKNNTVRVALPSLGYVMYADLEKSSITKLPS